MAILDAEKLFVDSSDDITTIINRVNKSPGNALILVIPQNSGLFASVISLKILYRRSLEARKDIIIVTEDVFGGKISQQAGFVFVNKVSQITSDLWDIVNDKNLKTKAFLDGRGKTSAVPEENNIEADKVKESIAETIEEHEIEIDLTPKDIESYSENEIDREDVVQKSESEEKPVQNRSKVVTLKGIKIMSGGDVAQKNKVDGDAKIDKLDNNEENITNNMKNSTFTGRDFTKVRVEKGIFDKFFELFKKEKKPEDRFEDPELVAKRNKRKRNQILAIVGIIFLFIAILSYLVLNQWSSVQVNITLKKEEVLATETVRLKFDEDYVYDEEIPDVVPALEIRSDDQSVSRSATADGKAKSGTKATGKIYVINNSTDAINIPAGTLITDTVSGLDYVIKQSVNLKAGTLGDDNTVNAVTTSNIGIEAATFGEEFNLVNPQFAINDFESLVADIDVGGDLEGGFAEDVVVVSQENVDALVKGIESDIKSAAEKDLRSSVPNGFRLIEESIEFSEADVSSNPVVGEKPSSGGTFDVTIVINATGIVVEEDDLESALSLSLSSSSAEGASGLSVNELSNITTTDYTNAGEEVFITIGAEGDITNQLTEDEIEALIKGKSIERAQEILEEIENITSAEIIYSPALVPGSFRKVPSNNEKINLKFE